MKCAQSHCDYLLAIAHIISTVLCHSVLSNDKSIWLLGLIEDAQAHCVLLILELNLRSVIHVFVYVTVSNCLRISNMSCAGSCLKQILSFESHFMCFCP